MAGCRLQKGGFRSLCRGFMCLYILFGLLIFISTLNFISVRVILQHRHNTEEEEFSLNKFELHNEEERFPTNMTTKDSLAISNMIDVLTEHGFIIRKNDSKEISNGTVAHNTPTKMLSCKDINALVLGKPLGSGVTKQVFQSNYHGKDVVVKVITGKGSEITKCLDKGTDLLTCHRISNSKLVREITLSLQLDHRNILKPLGFCIRSEAVTSPLVNNGVVLVTKMGRDINRVLTQMSNGEWSTRLEHAIQMTDLMHYLAYSPVGDLRLYDFARRNFILLNNQTIKLCDMDSYVINEPRCQTIKDCHSKDYDPAFEVNCIKRSCIGFNARFNLMKCKQLFLESLLANPPNDVHHNVTDILKKIDRNEFNARQAVIALSSLRNIDNR